MRYMVRKSVVRIIGEIWMPPGVICAQEKELREYDVRNCRDDSGDITRESIDRWLALNSGDFSNITDFFASIEYGDDTIEIPWKSEENECTFMDCMYPCETPGD